MKKYFYFLLSLVLASVAIGETKDGSTRFFDRISDEFVEDMLEEALSDVRLIIIGSSFISDGHISRKTFSVRIPNVKPDDDHADLVDVITQSFENRVLEANLKLGVRQSWGRPTGMARHFFDYDSNGSMYVIKSDDGENTLLWMLFMEFMTR